MKGFNVLHPMGWDAFGLPAEQYAVQTGTHPRETTAKNIANFRRQIERIGFSYDWSREINTTDPAYYKWTQWIFLQLYKKGLAYVSHAPVWYCPALGTVLANEEVLTTDEGPALRARQPSRRAPPAAPVDAEDHRLRRAPARPISTCSTGPSRSRKCSATGSAAAKARRSISLSAGRVRHRHGEAIAASRQITVFTTRPDTLFGATYMVLVAGASAGRADHHAGQRDAVAKYKAEVANKSDLERTDLAKEQDRRLHRRAMRSIRSTARKFRSGSPTTSSWATAPARSWPCPRMTSAITSLRRSINLPIIEVVESLQSASGLRSDDHRACAVHRRRPRHQLRLPRRPAHRRGQGQDDRLARGKEARHAPRPVQAARLALLPPTLLGRAVPDRLERRPARGHSREANCR